jgi:hypothetical protein
VSLRVLTWVFDHAPTADAAEQAVLLAIGDRCNDGGDGSYQSIPTIARRARLSPRAVYKVIERLKAKGILSVERGASRRGTNSYTVRLDPCTTFTPEPRSPLNHVQVTPEPRSGHPLNHVQVTPEPRSPDPYRDPSIDPYKTQELTLSALVVTVDQAETVKDLWNETTTSPIPKCQDLTLQRRRHAEARLKERGIDGLREIFTRINASAFCRGESDRGWLASFDWALKPASIAKVLEGAYDSTPRRTPPGSGRTGAPANASKYAALVQRDPLTEIPS